jgi:adenylate cyclase class IV
LNFENHSVEGALDDVEDLGPYVELELLADETTRDQANRVIGRLANELQLGPVERRSYLEMLLESRL